MGVQKYKKQLTKRSQLYASTNDKRKKSKSESKSIEKKAFSLIKLKNLVKEYNKIIKLIQPEMIDDLKEKGFFVFKVIEGKETFEGSIDLLTKEY